MRLVKAIITLTWLCLALLLLQSCGDDDENNPVDGNPPQNTPSELVGIWDWTAAMQDGTPVTDFAEVSYTDTSTAQEFQFNAGGTWETREYYDGSGPVYTRSGTCYSADSLYLSCTNNNGTPENGDPIGYQWLVVGDLLTVATKLIVPTNDTIIVSSTYTKR